MPDGTNNPKASDPADGPHPSPSTVLGLIPARGGSKGIHRKNLALLNGLPLIQYTFNAALGSCMLDRIILTTDDEEIAAVGRASKVDVPFMRPAPLATDQASTRSVQQHALRWLEIHEGYIPDAVATLQPTSPFRSARHIDEAVQEFHIRGVDTVIGVTSVKQHPYEVVGFVEDRMVRPVSRPDNITRRQDYPPMFYVNGAVYVTGRQVLVENDFGYGERVFGYEMDSVSSVDIDDPFDLQIAECLLKLGSWSSDHASS